MTYAPPGPLAISHWQSGSPAQRFHRTVGDVLRTSAALVPDRAALVFGDRQWTYEELLTEATGGARALLSSFIPGDVVAVWAENCPQWIALEFAAGLAGLTLVPLNPAAGAEEVAYVLAHSGARGIFAGTDQHGGSRFGILHLVAHRLPAMRFVISLGEWDTLCAIGSLNVPGGDLPGGFSIGDRGLPDVDPDSPAQILYTAGTTGRPKAALLTHRGLVGNAGVALRAFGGRTGDTVVDAVSLSQAAGCGLMTLGIAQLAGTHVLAPDPGTGPLSGTGPLLALAERHRCGILCTDPETLPGLLADPSLPGRDLGALRALVSGGAPLAPETAHEAETAFGAPVLTGLFQAEAGGVITATTPDDTLASRLGSAGRPLPGTELKITSLRTGDTVACEEVGEIHVRGSQVMRGYLNDPGPTAQALSSDGWLCTGDLGAMDSRGYCRIVGRARELIVRGGQDVYPREVETVLCTHPAVAEAAVVGVPDRFWGETVTAIVRLSRPLDSPALELTEHCGGRLASFKIPVRWLFADSLPRTTRGKVRKVALSTRFADATEPDWQFWTMQTPADLAAVFGPSHHDPLDSSGPAGPAADLLELRVPPQEPWSRALEDIDF
jgi:acyl-CoA synthetase (AMP-forming)/AMP-acid ligase II